MTKTTQPTTPRRDPWAYLMLLLRHRPRSVAEARRRLAEQGFEPAAIEQVIQQAIAVRQLDDEAFATLWVRDRMWHRPMSRAAVAQELHDKAVPGALITRALDAEYPPVRELELARQLAETRLPRWRGLPPETRRRRMVALLQRRGFSPAIAYQVASTLEKEAELDES